MKSLLLLAIFFCGCMVTRDPDEYEQAKAMLMFVVREERFSRQYNEMRVVKKKQTWEFLDNHYQIIEYVDTANNQEIGMIEYKDRRK